MENQSNTNTNTCELVWDNVSTLSGRGGSDERHGYG